MTIARSWAILDQVSLSWDNAFDPPAEHGGSQLDSSSGLGEPLALNVR